MTVAVDLETRIERPRQAVFAALTDVERYPEWLVASGIVGVERLDPGPLVPGSRLRIAQTVAGRSAVLEGDVTTLVPGSTFGLRAKDRDGVTIEIETMVGTDGPLTAVRWALRLKLPLKYRMFESMIAPQAKRAAALDLESLKRRLESVAEG